MSLERSTIVPVAYPPITEAGQIDLKDIVAIQLRNAGTATVLLFSGAAGMYTLDSKETLSINVTEDGIATLNLSNPPIQVKFDTGSGVIQRLEYFVLRRQFPNVC